MAVARPDDSVEKVRAVRSFCAGSGRVVFMTGLFGSIGLLFLALIFGF